jgi:hypothetical protein
MVKSQLHDTFLSFTGTSIPELSKLVADYVATNKLASKSLSVVNWNGKLIASIGVTAAGFRSDEAAYPVTIESVALNVFGDDLSERIEKAVTIISGDPICHSLYFDINGIPSVAFLVYG